MNTNHQAIVPPWAGRPWCTCGYVGGNGIDRPLLADHMREVEHVCVARVRKGDAWICLDCGAAS